ncbi:hypothetical protein T484DRAFT_1782998 [Baffinella frigidus]|nr:hypothetical protein T484DRAFT_1782998 [Cryptophyta sp. CCMP2293]
MRGVDAKWKLLRRGETPRCLLDAYGLETLAALQGGFLRTLHFLDVDASAVCLQLELQYREFLICRSGLDHFFVTAGTPTL